MNGSRKIADNEARVLAAVYRYVLSRSQEKTTNDSDEEKALMRDREEVSNVNPAGDQASEIVNH